MDTRSLVEIQGQIKNEITERIKLRTQINYVKMAVIGGVLVYALQSSSDISNWFFAFLCIIAFSFDLSIIHNSYYINSLGNYLAREIEPKIKIVKGWAGSVREEKSLFIWDILDRLGYAIITLAIFFFSFIKVFSSRTSFLTITVFAIALVCATALEIFLIWLSLIKRKIIKNTKQKEDQIMNAKRILISGVVIWIVSSIFGFLTCGWLFNWVYQLPPNIWLAPTTIMSPGNMIGAHINGIIRGLLFALVFAILFKGIPGKGVNKGMIYGVLVWLVGSLPGIASMPFYMTIATTVVVYWIILQLVMGVIEGAIVGAIYKEKAKAKKKSRR
jgi:hypothetical protein